MTSTTQLAAQEGAGQWGFHFKQFSLALLTSALLSACGGGGGDDINVQSASALSLQPTQEQQSDLDVVDPVVDGDDFIGDQDDDVEDLTGEPYSPPAEYPKAVTLPLQFIETLGGKKLAARVTLPADENGNPLPGPFPVILTQSAYNTNLLSLMLEIVPGNLLLGASDSYVVRRGYAQVAVDARGTGISEGGWELLGPDEQIGFADAVDWAKRQPWSNGKLGVAGVSYMAISSLFAAQHRPDDIDAVFASLPMGDAMRGTVGIGGMLNGLFMSTWMQLTHFTATQNVPVSLMHLDHMNYIMEVTQEHVDQIDNFYLPMINSALDGWAMYSYESDFWTVRSPITEMDKVKAPTFILGALHDLFQRDEPQLFEILQKNNVDSKLVIYDGSHFVNFVATHVGNGKVPPVDLLLLQWFDKHLKGRDTGIEDMPAVTQYVKNYSGKYATTSTWPHPQARAERWYLRDDEGLSREAPQTDETGPIMTQPEHPSGRGYYANGLLGFELHINDGTECSRSFDQWTLGLNLPNSCFSNADKTTQQRLVFETEPMQEDYYINGPIQADIWIESTVTEAVVAVQVEEVSKRQSLPITNGQLLASGRWNNTERSRYLDGEMIQPYHYFTEEKSQPLVPGEVVKLSVEIFPTSAIIRKGNRLRIAVSPSNQAQALLSYPRQAQTEGGVTTIHMSPEHPSSVVFPVVPTSALN